MNNDIVFSPPALESKSMQMQMQKRAPKVLFIGGARSGKSGLAEQYVAEQFNIENETPVYYIATAENHPSMAERIALHQQRRPSHWHCIEEPLALAELLERPPATSQHKKWPTKIIILVDCLTLWVTNQLMRVLAGSEHIPTEQLAQVLETSMRPPIKALCQAIAASPHAIVLVSTDAGSGFPIDDPLSQAFIGACGELHQRLGAQLDQVYFCTSGQAVPLKSSRSDRA